MDKLKLTCGKCLKKKHGRKMAGFTKKYSEKLAGTCSSCGEVKGKVYKVS